jgi:hypothetical protein
MMGSSTTDLHRKRFSRTRLRALASKVRRNQPLKQQHMTDHHSLAYAKRNGIDYNPLDYYAVPLKIAKQIAAECKFEFQSGDIIFLRTGKQRFGTC